MHGKFHTIGMSLQYQWLCVICGVCLETLVLQRYLYIFDTFYLLHFRGFRVGFNSLCAFASVNHQHLHAYYLDYDIFTENCVSHT